MWIARHDFERGDYGTARKLEEQVLAACRRLLGPEPPYTLRATNNLARKVKAQGDLGGARQLQEQVLEARRRLLRPEHPDTSLSAWNLFQILVEIGDENSAIAVVTSYLAPSRGQESGDFVRD